MLYLLDTANIKEIEDAVSYYPLAGVTTNPTILTKEDEAPITVLKKIKAIIGEDRMLHAQVIAQTADGMIKDARQLQEALGKDVYVKIPVSREGIQAMMRLAGTCNITATAIVTAQQALLAARAGAHFVAPYVNRIDMIGGSGVDTVKEIVEIYTRNGIQTKVLAASFKNTRQVHQVALHGGHSATVPKEILDKLLYHQHTEWSIDTFCEDWIKKYGNLSL